MGIGLMRDSCEILSMVSKKDSEGFASDRLMLVKKVRCYREGRHGSQRWANMAAFSQATDLFRFRVIPGITVSTDNYIRMGDEVFDIVSVENVKGRGMYIECLAKRSDPTIGKS